MAAARGVTTLPVDAFKLPHHGSKGNVLEALVKVAPAQHYVMSSNGDTFHHPDDQAVARVVMQRAAGGDAVVQLPQPAHRALGRPGPARAARLPDRATPTTRRAAWSSSFRRGDAMTQLPWPATHSLLREELLDLPGAVFGDPRVDGPLQALLAGEPQRALALLAAQPARPEVGRRPDGLGAAARPQLVPR